MESRIRKTEGHSSKEERLLLLQELPGRAVGRYQIDEQLRPTQMGVLFMAHHLRLNMPVTIEVVDPVLLASTPGIAPQLIGTGNRLERFNHPNIVHLLECGEASGLLFVVTEYVDGITLSELLLLNGQFDQLHALTMVQTAARALMAAHELGIIHADISPSQFIVTKTKRLKLAGFTPTGRLHKGFAEITGKRGATHYDAPEWFDDSLVPDQRADIYSLGASLYHLVTGMPPFKGRTPEEMARMHREANLVPPADLDGKIAAEVSAYICQLMAKLPKDRPANAAEVCENIDTLLEMFRDDISGSSPSARFVRELQEMFGGTRQGTDGDA